MAQFPLSAPVRSAMRDCLTDFGRQDWMHTGHGMDNEKLGEVGHMLSLPSADLAFVPNTTAGVTSIALCFPWKAGDRVIVFDGEFPTNVTPWQQAASLFGLELVTLSISDFARSVAPDFNALEATLARGVRLVAVSAVQFQTGLQVPIEEIARRCDHWGAELFVDGIQAVGAVLSRWTVFTIWPQVGTSG